MDIFSVISPYLEKPMSHVRTADLLVILSGVEGPLNLTQQPFLNSTILTPPGGMF